MELRTNVVEKTILGILVRNDKRWPEITNSLSEKDFSCYEHRVIYHAVTQLLRNNHPFDAVTVAEWLVNKQMLSTIGGISALASLLNPIPQKIDINVYLDAIRTASKIRNSQNNIDQDEATD